MNTVYFGPEKNVPSWYWVGKDIANKLSTQINVKFFRSIEEIDNSASVFWIKNPPSPDRLDKIKKKNLNIIYFPIDSYDSEQDVKKDENFVDFCKLIVLHTKTMKSFFNYKKIDYIDHYNKFGINGYQRKPEKYFLWVGGYQYFPYIVYYVRKNKLKIPMIALTDSKSQSAINAANILAKKLNLNYDFTSSKKFTEFEVVEWSEERQKELLRTCIGAFDYKHCDDFNQKYKPPTKTQKYVSSFIPTALNCDSYSYKYLQDFGLNVCEPIEIDVWQSESYKNKTIDLGKQFIDMFSIDTISKRYLEFLKCL
jgi:hypothetical protein